MRVPQEPEDASAYRGQGHSMQTASEGTSNRRMIFFSRSRADLGLTLVVAAALALMTLVLFKLDDDVQLLEYNHDMRPASCTVVSGELQSIMTPQGPPEIEGIPPEEKWRAEVVVDVNPNDSEIQPFQARAHDTLRGQFSSVKEYQEQWLESHEVNSSDTCYYGVNAETGRRVVVVDLESALTKVTTGWAGPHSSFAMHVSKIIVAFFAFVFAGLVIFKLVAGKWDEPLDGGSPESAALLPPKGTQPPGSGGLYQGAGVGGGGLYQVRPHTLIA